MEGHSVRICLSRSISTNNVGTTATADRKILIGVDVPLTVNRDSIVSLMSPVAPATSLASWRWVAIVSSQLTPIRPTAPLWIATTVPLEADMSFGCEPISGYVRASSNIYTRYVLCDFRHLSMTFRRSE